MQRGKAAGAALVGRFPSLQLINRPPCFQTQLSPTPPEAEMLEPSGAGCPHLGHFSWARRNDSFELHSQCFGRMLGQKWKQQRTRSGKQKAKYIFLIIIFPRFKDCLLPNEIQPLDCKTQYKKLKTTGKQQEEHTLWENRVEQGLCDKFWINLSAVCIYLLCGRTSWSFKCGRWVMMPKCSLASVSPKALQWPASHQKHKSDDHYPFAWGIRDK